MSRAPSGPRRAGSGMDFAALQRWMLDAVTAPHRTDAAGQATAAAAAERVQGAILPSDRLTARERIGVYTSMYFLRLRDIMAGDFKAVRAVMGADAFSDVVRGYLTYQPPHGFTLNSLGYALPRYLATRHEPRDPLLVDVARLEAAMEITRHADESPTVSAQDLAAIPQERWGEIRFRPTSAFRLMTFDHDVHEVLSAVLAERELPALDPAPIRLALWRRDYEVWRQRLSPTMYEILRALAAGAPLGAAMAAGAAIWDGEEAALEARIFEWFADWLEEGFFQAVIPPS